MKLKSKSRSESGSGNDVPVASWADTNPSNFASLAKQAKQSGQRAPEFWVSNGESRLVRFLDHDATVSFKVYRLKVNGRWQKYVQPKPGKQNYFESALGLRPQQQFVFRVIDIEGYTNKRTGKKLSNLPRFYVVGARVYEQIRMLCKENSDSGPLNSYNIRVGRSGEGTETTYTFIPKSPTPLDPMMKKAIGTFPHWTEFYKPTSESQQQTVMAQVGNAPAEDED